MKLFEIVIYVVIAISCLIFIGSLIHNKIKTYMLKLNSIESEIDENLREKYDLIIKIKSIENEEDTEKEIDKIKKEDYSSFEFDRMLSDLERDIPNNKTKELEDVFYRLNNSTIKVNANKKYFNETVNRYNNYIYKFPGNIIRKIMHIKEKTYFDGKNMFDENIKDFKI